jgi:hypothetical protein
MKNIFSMFSLLLLLTVGVFFSDVPQAHAETLYFKNTPSNFDWNTLGNWWTDAGFTVPATSLPTTDDDVIISGGNVSSNSGPAASVNTLTVNSRQFGISVTVANGAIFNGTGVINGGGDVTLTGDATFNDTSYNFATISGNATFNDSSWNLYVVSGDATFNDTSYNQSTVYGDAVFNYASGGSITLNGTQQYGYVEGSAKGGDDILITEFIFNDSSINNGTITNAVFNNSSHNSGTVTGDAVFNDQSYNAYSGRVMGDAVFNYASSGTIVLNNNQVWSYVDGEVLDVSLNPITEFIFYGSSNVSGNKQHGSVVVPGNATFSDTSNNNGTISGSAIFYDSSSNGGTISGSASFRDASTNDGIVEGDACFGSSATNNGTVNGEITVCPAVVPTIYWYNSGVDANWETLEGNWWMDEAHTEQAEELPNENDEVLTLGTVGPEVNLDTWTQPAIIDVTATGISFTSDDEYGLSINVVGNAIFLGSAVNGGTINGDVVFNDYSYNDFTIFGDATFYDSSYNNDTIENDGFFYDISQNQGSVGGNAVFNRYSDEAIFANSAINTGDVSGNASFYALAINLGYISGNACFTETATNEGTVDGDISVCVAATTYTLTYTAGEGGTITGDSPQTVTEGDSGTEITAVPNVGYHFVDWSDGATAASRTDTNITEDISATANFAVNVVPQSPKGGSSGSRSKKIIMPRVVCSPGDQYNTQTGQTCATSISTNTPSSGSGSPVTLPTCTLTLTLRQGYRGEEVKCLQTKFGITTDGIFGPITKAGVVLFQKNNNLVPDGIVGPKTREVLE